MFTTFLGRLHVVLLPVLLWGCATFYPPPAARQARAADRAPDAATEPASSALADLEQDPCLSALQRADVDFEVVTDVPTDGIEFPVRVRGSLAGIQLETVGGNPIYGLLDCRLALALARWAPTLHEAGVQRIEHFSMFRPGARVASTGKVSGHARGLALDAARFHFHDGTVANVLHDWQDRERGGTPCPPRPHEAEPSRRLRTALCRAVEDALFQVVLTPHYDRDHANHLHLEVKPEVDWTFVR